MNAYENRIRRIIQQLMDAITDAPEVIDYLGARSDTNYEVNDGVVWQADDDKPDFVKEGLEGWQEL